MSHQAPNAEEPATLPAALLVDYAQQRLDALLKLGSNWHAKTLLDPHGPNAPQHARCIDELAQQVMHLYELGGLARLAGLAAHAGRIDALVETTHQQLGNMALDARLASVGLLHHKHQLIDAIRGGHAVAPTTTQVQ